MIPNFQTLMRPVLAYLDDGADRPTREVITHLPDHYHLTDDERAELIPSDVSGASRARCSGP